MAETITWRSYQKLVVKRIYEDLVEGRVVLLDSPTGSGKTLMVLYTGLMYARREGLKLVIGVRTRSQMNMYLKELKKWFSDTKYAFLIAKKDSCPLYAGRSGIESIDIDCQRCPLKDQVSPLRVLNVLRTCDDVLLGILKLNSSTPPICTYHSLRRLIDSADVVVVSYPYIFDPSVREPTIADILSESVLVVDEAHNIDRIPDMYEKRLTRGIIEQALKQAEKRLDEPLRKRVLEVLGVVKEKLIGLMESASREWYEEVELPVKLGGEELELLSEAASDIAHRIALEYVVEANWVKRVYEFFYHASLPGFHVYRLVQGNNKVLVVKPIEPSILTSILYSPRRLILMSGTLPDPDYIRGSWGVNREYDYIDVEMEYGPVFPNSRRLWVIVWDVTSRWSERGEEMWFKYAVLVEKAYKIAKKNVLVIATSYLEAQNIASRIDSSIPIFVESRDTILAEAVEFARSSKGVIVAVASGKLSEGVEFVDKDGSSLVDLVVIAGIPFPQPDDYTRRKTSILASKLKLNYYDALIRQASIIVRQAIGRSIRRDGDNVVAVLADRRYRDMRWMRLLKIKPRELLYSTVNSFEKDLTTRGIAR